MLKAVTCGSEKWLLTKAKENMLTVAEKADGSENAEGLFVTILITLRQMSV